MTALARGLPGCFGARMTGAGFGGCAVALVEASLAEDFAVRLLGAYRQEFEHHASVFVTAAASGAGPGGSLRPGDLVAKMFARICWERANGR